jgi:hypothetical protein
MQRRFRKRFCARGDQRLVPNDRYHQHQHYHDYYYYNHQFINFFLPLIIIIIIIFIIFTIIFIFIFILLLLVVLILLLLLFHYYYCHHHHHIVYAAVVIIIFLFDLRTSGCATDTPRSSFSTSLAPSPSRWASAAATCSRHLAASWPVISRSQRGSAFLCNNLASW